MDPQLINAPQHLAALKGVVPVLPDLISLALRVNGAFGNGFLATYGPEVGIQYGF